MATFRDLYPALDQWDDPDWFEDCADLSEGTDESDPNGCQADDGRFICTRPLGHEGPHVADDGFSVVSVWKNE